MSVRDDDYDEPTQEFDAAEYHRQYDEFVAGSRDTLVFGSRANDHDGSGTSDHEPGTGDHHHDEAPAPVAVNHWCPECRLWSEEDTLFCTRCFGELETWPSG